MTQWDKLISKILNLSKDLRFCELRKVLENYNYGSGVKSKSFITVISRIL